MNELLARLRSMKPRTVAIAAGSLAAVLVLGGTGLALASSVGNMAAALASSSPTPRASASPSPTESVPEPSETPAAEVDFTGYEMSGWMDRGRLYWRVNLPKSVLVAGDGDAAAVSDYDSRLSVPTSIEALLPTSSESADTITQGTESGQYSVTRDAASHRVSVIYNDAATLDEEQFIVVAYTFAVPAGTKGGTKFTNTVTVQGRSVKAAIEYRVDEPQADYGQIQIIAIDAVDKHPIAGALFDVSGGSNARRSVVTTDAKGVGVTTLLPPGTYDISGGQPDCHVMPDTRSVRVTAGQTTKVTIAFARAPDGCAFSDETPAPSPTPTP